MIKINGFKGIWTLSEVVALLHDTGTKFKTVLDPDFNGNHLLEVDALTEMSQDLKSNQPNPYINPTKSGVNDTHSLSDKNGG